MHRAICTWPRGASGGTPELVLVPATGAAASVVNVAVSQPVGLALDSAGQLYILDATYLNQLTVLPPDAGSYVLPLPANVLQDPSSIAFTAGANNLLVTDIVADDLFELSTSQAQLTFPVTAVTSPVTVSPSQSATIVSTGNVALKPSNTGSAYYETGNISEFQVQSTAICSGVTQLLPAQSCNLPAAFAPAYQGAQSLLLTSIFNSPSQVQLLLTGTTPNASSVTASPTFSPSSGTFSTAQTITLSDSTAGAVIYYTTDGSTPTTSSPVYHSAITITNTTTINAIALASGFTVSPVTSATYTFSPYLGNNAYSYNGTDTRNYINATYAVTGNDSGGYTATSCSFYQPSGTVTKGANIDCGLVPAPTPTTQSSSWLCHGTYSNPSSSAVGGWITIPLTGCGTLSPGTAYWISTDNNDPLIFPYGFWNCGGSCNGSAPTVGNGTYPYRYIAATYGQYTGMSTSMIAGGAYQASQYVTLGLNTPNQTATPTFTPGTGTYSTAQSATISDAASGAVVYYTTDGSTPTTSSTVYHSAITVTSTTTVNALAVAPGYS